MKRGNNPDTGQRGACGNSEAWFLQDACRYGFSACHEGSTRDPPADPEAMQVGERKRHVGHPKNYLYLRRGKALAGPRFQGSDSWGQHRITSLLGLYDALCVNLSYF